MNLGQGAAWAVVRKWVWEALDLVEFGRVVVFESAVIVLKEQAIYSQLAAGRKPQLRLPPAVHLHLRSAN